MATLGDKIYNFNKKYIKKTAVEVKKAEKTIEDELALPMEHETLRSKFQGDLTPEKRRDLALQSALFMKGITKKNSDTFRAWFSFYREDGVKIPQEDMNIIKLFERRTEIKRKFKIAGMCADIWGDGYLLIKFFEDDTKNKLMKEIPEGAEILDLIILNPECVIGVKYNEAKTQLYYHYFNPKKGEDKLIHPDRIVHVKTLDLPIDFFGVSKVDILRNILISSADIDIATGEILKWFSHGTQVLTKQGMQKGEREKALKLLREHPNYFAFSEKYKLDVTSPAAINPTPFYEHIEDAISAALVIPRQVLKGIEIGRVTGAEIGFADYYRDIKDNQDLIYTPLLMRLYELLAKSKDRDFSKYEMEWETTYIDEMAEAELLGKRVAAAVNARSSNPPLISVREARRMMNDGHLELDPDDEPEEKPVEQVVPPRKPNEPERPTPPDRLVKPVVRETTDDERELIATLKALREEVALKERKLGEKILEEQEKDG